MTTSPADHRAAALCAHVAREDAHALFVRAAGMVKVDPDAAVALARQAIALVAPAGAVAAVLSSAAGPLSAREVATLAGLPGHDARRYLLAGHARGQYRRSGRGPGLRWSDRG